MEKGLFFNAFPNNEYETGYDRNYSADDISNWLKAVITNGVIKTNSVAGTGEALGLKVLADSGLYIKVNVGLAVIEGKPYVNNSSLRLQLATAPTSGTRYDCVILRMDNTQSVNARKTYCYIKSLNHVPTETDLTRNDEIYDLLLAYVAVGANVTSIQQSYITDTRGNTTLCPWCTAVKGYEDYYDAIVQRFESNGTLTSAGTQFITDLAVSLYNEKYSLISVYCNGLREDEEDYSVDLTGSYIKIVFNATKSAGAEINVILENFIDGEGLENVLDQYTELVQEVENLSQINEFNYFCNGSTDNVEICQIVNDFFTSNEGRYYQTLKLNVIGRFGYSAPMGGEGSSASPYKIFAFDNTHTGGRRALVDFSNCYNLEFAVTQGKSTYIFSGTNICIKGANVVAVANYTTNTSVVAFEHLPRVRAEDCRFWLYGWTNTYIATRGEFINCKGNVRNYGGDSFCYIASNSVYLAVVGGEYTAHTQSSSATSSVLKSTNSNAITIMQDVIAPKIDLTNMYQTNAIYHTGGKLSCYGLVTQLTITSGTGASITGTISANPYNQLW